MSVNYYIKRIPKKEEVVEVQKVINSATPDNICEVMHDQMEYVDYISQYIHIGKQTNGWRFLWELWDNKYYDCSLKSIKEFLSKKISEGWEIQNEYEEKFTVDEFFNEIDPYLRAGDYGMNTYYSNMYKLEYDNDLNDNLRFSLNKDFR